MKNIKEIGFGILLLILVGAGIYFVTMEKVVPEGITRTVVENGIENYKGKTTAILVAGTFCPHCQKDVPEVEREVFEKVDLDNLNLIVNVTDGEEGKSFNTKMKQVFNKDLGFKELVGEECGFVPTWIVMDEAWKVVDSDCGNKKQTAGLINAIKKAGVKFKE